MHQLSTRLALIMFTAILAGFRCQATTIISVKSGNWGSSTTWSGGVIPSGEDQVTIRSGDTVIIESSGKYCASLTVEEGAILYANKSSVTSSPRYIYVYGDILCNGQIGHDTLYDLVGFNLEGRYCTISGSGSFDAARIRKYDNTSDSTTVTIAMNIHLRVGGTAIYNNRSGTVFIIHVEPGILVDVPGDGITPGNVAIDGVNGAASSTGGGILSVSGTLRVSGILYLTNSNSANPVSVEITTGGMIETASIVCPNSGSSGHTFTIADGGILKLTSGDWGEIGFTNNTYSFATGSEVWYTGDTTQVVGNPTDYYHLAITGDGTKTLPSSLDILGNLSIEAPASLIAEANTFLTVTGCCTLAGSDCLILRSPVNSTATASFIPSGAIMGTGTARVERWLSKYETAGDSRYHFISSPVTTQPIQPEFVEDPPNPLEDFYRWDEPTGTWVNSKDSSGNWNVGFQPGDNRTFIPGTGYLVAYPEDQIQSFSGVPNQGDFEADLSWSSGAYAGFMLIGNPYCSALNGAIDTWDKFNVDNAIWVWNGETGNYVCWNGTVGTLAGGIIPAMQGFFVHGCSPDPLLTIPASSRVHSSAPFLKHSIPDALTLTLAKDQHSDGMVIHINPAATEGYDHAYDALKLFGSNDAPQLFAIETDNRLSIDEKPLNGGETVVPIGYSTEDDGDFTFHVSGANAFATEKRVFLEDHVTATRIDLHVDSSYTFSSDAGFFEERFALIVENPLGLTEENAGNPVSITARSRQIVVRGLTLDEGSLQLTLHDASGRRVLTTTVTAGDPVVETTLPTGYYLATLQMKKETSSFKLCIVQ